MSEKHTMVFERDLDNGTFEALHKGTMEQRAKATEGQAMSAADAPNKDTYYITGSKGEDGAFVIDEIHRSGASTVRFAQRVQADEGLSQDRRNEEFEAYTHPEHVDVEGVRFSVGGPMSGEVKDLELATSDRAYKTFENAEKYLETAAVHINHGVGEAVHANQKAEREAPGHVFEKQIAFGLEQDGQLFAEEVHSQDHMPGRDECLMQLGRDHDGQVVVTQLSRKSAVSGEEPQLQDSVHFMGQKFEVGQPVGELEAHGNFSPEQAEKVQAVMTNMRHSYIRTTGEAPELKPGREMEMQVDDGMSR